MQQRQGAGVGGAYGVVTCLFFAWGFITSFNDPLIAAVKGIFRLTDVEAQLSAFAFFVAYGVMSLPAAVLLSRLKSVPTVLLSLGMMVAGCLIMMAAVNVTTYSLMLLGLFVLASGMTVLQVAANPLAAALGPPERSHFRLTFSQAFNSFGTFLGPILGAHLFLRGIEIKQGTAVTAGRPGDRARRDRPRLSLARGDAGPHRPDDLRRAPADRRRRAAAAPRDRPARHRRNHRAKRSPRAGRCSAALAIFLYVGAEVAIGTQMALFLNSNLDLGPLRRALRCAVVSLVVAQDGVFGLSLEQAGKATALYWGGAMVGRFVGSALLTRVPGAAAARDVHRDRLRALPVRVRGRWSQRRLGRAVDRPVQLDHVPGDLHHHARALDGIGGGDLRLPLLFDRRRRASSPLIVGLVSQHSSYVTAFIVPALCYAVLCLFAIASRRARIHLREEPGAATIH